MRMSLLCVAVVAVAGSAARTTSLQAPATTVAEAAEGLQLSIGADTVQPGGAFLLTLRSAMPLARATAHVFDLEVPLDATNTATTWQALVGVDLAIKAGSYPVTVTTVDAASDRAGTAQTSLQVLARRFPTRRLRVAPRFVDPPADEVTRITAEAATLSAIFASRTPRQWRGPFRAPAPGTPNSNFGLRSVFNGQARNPHAGVDYAGPTGLPIAAPDAGTVVLAQDLYFTGNTVIVDHGAGLFSLFAHLSRIAVTAGQPVEPGAVVGQLGATGRVTGPHLHWAVRLYGARVDPLAVVAALRTAP